jgi:hypothetical protein
MRGVNMMYAIIGTLLLPLIHCTVDYLLAWTDVIQVIFFVLGGLRRIWL